MKLKALLLTTYFFTLTIINLSAQDTKPEILGTVWPIEKSSAWYKQYPWMSGANFLPSTAINQLEMWQAETFDPATIDKELGWAESIGFNTMRVYLHSIAWKEDPVGFKTG